MYIYIYIYMYIWACAIIPLPHHRGIGSNVENSIPKPSIISKNIRKHGRHDNRISIRGLQDVGNKPCAFP